MIIINIEGKTSIESALKTLNDRKTYKKKSEERRSVVKKAKFIESKRKGLE